jgi:superoxide dismutase
MVVPTDVIDIYEHAFYVDYQNRKTDYVEKFIDIRWFAGANTLKSLNSLIFDAQDL